MKTVSAIYFMTDLYVSRPFLKVHSQMVCYYQVIYVSDNESTLYSCLDVEKLLARIKRDIWILSDSSEIRTHNHLVRQRTLTHLTKTAWF